MSQENSSRWSAQTDHVHAPISETGLGYDVFAPLWGILELGAATESGAKALRDVSLAGFVAAHRNEIDRLLALIRDVGDFSPETMAIFESQGGWNDCREVTAEYLTMYSGYIESYPPRIDDPAVLRRMVRMGRDLQLVTFLDALVGTATVRGPGPGTAVPLVVDAVRTAGSLLGVRNDRVVADTFRMWRVTSLPNILRPDSPLSAGAKAQFRTYAHGLEHAIDPYA
ncbi:hypothetical protein [Streptomyces rhizosphaerihabitans]|uniref:hypothetical protein n=1 Tax=Streptomyces rhizosphaerihabitans TaxID=1266770 RepID=UPI0021C090B7|nr:hypothetical protein [Streptomyces rhizosphaerihabitans]MCT9006941.1 hypothetical protein [Streptomyces rhizosphaerihabitans]